MQKISARVIRKMLLDFTPALFHQPLHHFGRVLQASRGPQHPYRRLDLVLVRCLRLQYRQECLFVVESGVLQEVDDHQRNLPLVNVFPVISLGFFKLLSLQVQQVVLDLECHSHSLRKAHQGLGLHLPHSQVLTDQPRRQSGEHSRFMGSHLTVLLFGGIFLVQLIQVVPKDVPALPDVEIDHFLDVYFAHPAGLLGSVLLMLQQVEHGSVVHEVAGVETDVHSVQRVDAGLVSAHQRVVLHVVDYQAAVVHDLAQGGDLEHLFFLAAEQLGDEHAQDWPPPLAPPIEQVPNGLGEGLGQGVQVAVFLPVVEIVGEVLEVFL